MLKELNFSEPVRAVYCDGHKDIFVFGYPDNFNNYEKFFSAPELWMVVEWLRINHNLWHRVHPTDHEGWRYLVYEIRDCPIWKGTGYGIPTPYSTPEEAYSSAILYTLNKLINDSHKAKNGNNTAQAQGINGSDQA
jgi:hypothetical protein